MKKWNHAHLSKLDTITTIGPLQLKKELKKVRYWVYTSAEEDASGFGFPIYVESLVGDAWVLTDCYDGGV